MSGLTSHLTIRFPHRTITTTNKSISIQLPALTIHHRPLAVQASTHSWPKVVSLTLCLTKYPPPLNFTSAQP